MVAIGAFDVPSSVLDLTLFLPYFLGDNNTIGLNITTSSNPFWLVSSRLHVWTDGKPNYNAHDDILMSEIISSHIMPTIPVETILVGPKDFYTAITTAHNHIFVKGKQKQKDGNWTFITIERQVHFKNTIIFSNQNQTQSFDLLTKIDSKIYTYKEIQGVPLISLETLHREYPLFGNLTIINQDGKDEEDEKYEFQTKIRVGFEEKQVGIYSYPNESKYVYEKNFKTHQHGQGYFGTIRPGIASLNQSLVYTSPSRCYSRHVQTYNQSILQDNVIDNC